jgi:hypothetical protein
MMMTEDGGRTWIDLWNPVADPVRTIEAEDAARRAKEEAEQAAAEAAEAAEAGDPPADDPAEPEVAVEVPTDPAPPADTEPTEPEEPIAAPQADAITGTWDCVAAGEGIETDDDGKFTLELELGEGGKVTGTLSSPIGDGDVKDGRYDAETKTLRFVFSTDTARFDFEFEVDGEEMEGNLSAAGGAFHFTATGKRRKPQDPRKVIDGPTAETRTMLRSIGYLGQDDEPAEEPPEEVEEREVPDDCLEALLPGRRYVSQIYASHHDRDRVYASFDGHRQDDDAPHLFVSEDKGRTWRSLTKKLSKHVGSIRAVHEDHVNENVLYVGCEFGAYVSVDRGETWTRMNGNLPTVPVHDFAQHPTSGELIAGTHGRSIWICDVSVLRQSSEEVVDADAHLFTPNPAFQWRSLPRRANATLRMFRGENPASGATLSYSLSKRAREVTLRVEDHAGNTIRTLEAPTDKGLHRVVWDLRGAPPQAEEGGRRRRFRRGRLMDPGTYRVVLEVDGEEHATNVVVRMDPNYPSEDWVETEAEARRVEALLEAATDDEGGDEEADTDR